MKPINPEYTLKFLLVGDADVGKNEILEAFSGFESNPPPQQTHRCGKILLEGRKIQLNLWDAGGQGRFLTVLRSYSRGAQGVLIVFDITNRWSFEGVHRWIREVEQQAPGLPKILVGNRLHLEFDRRVSREEGLECASQYHIPYFEVSPLCSFNVVESLTELSRLVLLRNRMGRLWKTNLVPSLQEFCARTIIRCVADVHHIDQLPVPTRQRLQIRSYANTGQLTAASNSLNRKSRPTTSPGGTMSRIFSGCQKKHKRCQSEGISRGETHTPTAATNNDHNSNRTPRRRSHLFRLHSDDSQFPASCEEQVFGCGRSHVVQIVQTSSDRRQPARSPACTIL